MYGTDYSFLPTEKKLIWMGLSHDIKLHYNNIRAHGGSMDMAWDVVKTFLEAQTTSPVQPGAVYPTSLEELDIFFQNIPTTESPEQKQPSSNTLPIKKLYNYRALTLHKTAGAQYTKNTPLKNPEFQFCHYDTNVGIEIEVENITSPLSYSNFWEVKQDGSLRNNGIELVSHPLPVANIQHALELAFNTLYANNKPDFSNRTSIHIHLNCREMTQDQIWVMCILYAIFEKHFYQFAGTKRLNSIFCVPLYRCNILTNLHDVIYKFKSAWHKYCGLNILPLVNHGEHAAFGTVEFRHLYGTNDQQLILNWINQILALQKAALVLTKEEVLHKIATMNTSSSYLHLFSQIFGEVSSIPNKQGFEECISNIKRELNSNTYVKTINKDSSGIYWTTAQKHNLKG